MWSPDENSNILSIHDHPDKPLIKTTDNGCAKWYGFLNGINTQFILDIDQSEIQVSFETKGEGQTKFVADKNVVKVKFIELRDNYKSQTTSERTLCTSELKVNRIPVQEDSFKVS